MTEPTQPEPPPSPPPVGYPTQPPVAPAASERRQSPVVWTVALALAAVVGALLFAAGFLASGSRGSGACEAPSEAFVAFCDAYDKLKQQFVDALDDEALAEGAIQGMFEYGVRDPFSGYMSPDDYRRALGDLSGSFSGIGAEMAVENLENPDDLAACTQLSDICALVVVAPIADSPAERAGLQSGDRVLAVDGESVNGSTLEAEVNRVRGEAGTRVTLTLDRDGERLDLTITREEIQIREVTSRMLDGNVGYIALHGFSQDSAEQFQDALSELLDAGATSIAFDLRDNPGGYIDAANDIASEFIEDGLIFIQEGAGDDVKNWEATGDGVATDPGIPVVVLINAGSASASEIVAAALQERGRATLVGEPSFGKNTVQLWDELDNGGGVRITISRWFTPNHNTVAPDGIQPDEVVEIPDGTPPDRDLVLERAVEILTDAAVGDPEASPEPDGAGLPRALTPLRAPISYAPSGLSVASA